MPESDIRDDINRIRDTTWSNPLKVCVLQHYYTGYFCFPLGPEFGCGSAISITEQEARTVSGKFSAGGAEVGASVTHTESTGWSHTSGRCEWCTPQVCYPDSNMEIWECEAFIDFYSWATEFVRFTPGRPQFFPNCVVDNERCDCQQTSSAAFVPGGSGGYVGVAGDSHRTAVVRTIDFLKRPDAKPTDTEEDLNEAASHLEALVDQAGRGSCAENRCLRR